MSSEDIARGTRWSDALARELKGTDFGIIFITPFNVNAAWLGFEAGALSKAIASARVIPLLFDVRAEELTGPLSQFQSTQYNKEEVFNLVSSLNGMLGDEARVDKGLLRRVFEKWWPDLEEAIERLPRDQEGSTESGIEWLYRPGDLTREEIADEITSIWVVTPSPYQDLQRTCIKELIQRNIQRRVRYTFIMPDSEENELVKERLDQIFNGHGGDLLKVVRIEADTFNSLAVTHYLILNPDSLEENPEALLELPIVQRDFWVKVSSKAAFGFVDRFRRMTFLASPGHAFPVTKISPPTPQGTGDVGASQLLGIGASAGPKRPKGSGPKRSGPKQPSESAEVATS
jgi:hypothetical protein